MEETENLSPRHTLEWIGTDLHEIDKDNWSIRLRTNDGVIVGHYHPVVKRAAKGAVIWVGGAGGGLEGPARGLYPAACQRLQPKKVAGLRLHYRYPNVLEECILDVLLGIQFVLGQGIHAIGLVGHSFGGAVVISAGAMSEAVQAVVPMSTQTYGVVLAPEVSPRAMLIIHGTSDEILPDRCSRYVHSIARHPKELKLFSGARHGLDEVREDLLDLLVDWLPNHLRRSAAAAKKKR